MRRHLGAAAVVFAALALFATPASASHGGGGGGGGGGGTTAPPAGAPIATFSTTNLNYGSQELGTSSAPQTVTITNTGTASLFINGVGVPQGSGDFHETGGDCIAATIPVGGSCSIIVFFEPTVTGARAGTISVLDTAAGSPTILNYTGVGVSAGGPTPISVVTPPGIPCTNGVCDTGLTTIVNDFYFTTFSAGGDLTATPITWSLAAGTLPPGTTLKPDGTLVGFPSQTGTFTFTVRVTDATGRTATQAFSQTISPVPPAGDPRCTHSPNEPGALSGAAIGGKAPSGQANIDTSKFTACGGFYTINVSVKNVNLPNGTVLWVTLSGRPLGEITLSNGTGSIKPFVFSGALRKESIQIYSHIPPLGIFESPILGSGFFT